MKYAAMPRLTLELAILRIMEDVAYGGRIAAFEARLTELENGQSAVAVASSSGAPVARSRTSSKAAQNPDPVESASPPGRSERAVEHSRREEKPSPISEDDEDQLSTVAASLGSEESKIWETVMGRIKKERIALHAILQNGRVLGFRSGELEIVFTQEFHRKILEMPENRSTLERVYAAVSGQECRVKAFLAKEILNRSQTPSTTAASRQHETGQEQAESVSERAQPIEEQAIVQQDMIVEVAQLLVGEQHVRIIDSKERS